MTKPMAAVIMGSASDAEIMDGVTSMLKILKIPFEKKIISAHRNAKKLTDYIEKAEDKGIEVIIAGAGRAAHLPGAIAALTVIPVIGIPISGPELGGLDALLSIVQMPSGVPVATVAINGVKNGAVLAAEILALKHASIKEVLVEYKRDLAAKSGSGD